MKRRRAPRRSARRTKGVGWCGIARVLVEAAALATTGIVGAVVGLGALAGRSPRPAGSRGVLMVGGAVLGLALVLAACVWLWWHFRRRAVRAWSVLPAACAGVAAIAAVWVVRQPSVEREVANLREAVGGIAEAERATIAHQVYAAYRRADLKQVAIVLERARVFEVTIREASATFDVDPEVLVGIGFAESSFYPRDSADGGRGVFQITAAPASAVARVRKRLQASELDPLNQRHNAFIAAATLRRYLDEMRGDLFLGLLAYNIGPHNGGLRAIMQQYGARDFVTIQPYLQRLPRDYPIRVLSAALAYRLWRVEGRLPRYEEGDNARRIQAVGIPGFTESSAQEARNGTVKEPRR